MDGNINNSGDNTNLNYSKYYSNNYFNTQWSQNKFCNVENVQEIFNNNDKNSFIDKETNNYFLFSNKDLYQKQFDNYSNGIQLYYRLIEQNEDTSNEYSDKIKINKLTPILIQKTENILSTLLFITLDQNHDFRGGRTAGTDSWVTVRKSNLIKKISLENEQEIKEPFDNPYLTTLINTSFSGHKSIIGILMIDDKNLNILQNSLEYLDDNKKINISKIMQ
jgi:hypothetical protein